MNGFKLLYKLSAEVDKKEDVDAVYLKKPVIVGFLELDKEANLKYSNSIRYFQLPKMQNYPLNLNLGIRKENYESRIDFSQKYKLKKVFRYFMDHHTDDSDIDKSKEQLDGGDEKFDIVSNRGALTLILLTPLNARWTIYATYYNKKLYIQNTYDHNNYFGNVAQIYHYKFAQHCFADDPDKDPDINALIHNSDEMYCVYRSQVKNLNLIYSSEINGILRNTKLDDVQNFEELNKCRFVLTKLMPKNIRNWRKSSKIRKWWAQSYFTAVNDIYVGFKSDLGYVDFPIEHVLLNELIREQEWSPKVCSTFLYRILTKIIEEVKDRNCPHTTYEIRFDPSRQLIEIKKHEGRTDKSFLTDEYVEHLTK